MNLADAMCINFLVPTLTAFVSYVWLRVSRELPFYPPFRVSKLLVRVFPLGKDPTVRIS